MISCYSFVPRKESVVPLWIKLFGFLPHPWYQSLEISPSLPPHLLEVLKGLPETAASKTFQEKPPLRNSFLGPL